MLHRTQGHCLFALTLLGLVLSCGQGSHKKKSGPPPLGPTTQAFLHTARDYKIPQDILLAIAYKESGINPHSSQTYYGPDRQAIGPRLAETAMGLSASTLGLPEAPANDLATQLDAYGSWVQKNLETQHLDLPSSLSKNDDVYDWAWQLARLHHGGTLNSKNVQIIFALELIDVLNKGFMWQDPITKERITLVPRTPQLETSSFSLPIQANLKLDTRTSELFFVDYLQLTYGNLNGQENHPKRIIVVHCPFTVSTCIGDQLQKAEGRFVPLEAHYVIPSTTDVLSNPIKILQHKNPVQTFDAEGQAHVLTDAIVVMLSGNSGRYYEGQRIDVRPDWYKRGQLKNLGKVVLGICELMNREDPSLDIANCRKPGVGVEFTHARLHDSFRFGDIADFDSAIFGAFLNNPDDLSGDIQIQLPGKQQLFAAGSRITPALSFIKGTAKLDVQLLERCRSGKTVWSNIQTHFLRNTDNKTIELTLFDQGPNANGQHFIRVLGYDNQGKLMGWATQTLFLSNYDNESSAPPSGDECEN